MNVYFKIIWIYLILLLSAGVQTVFAREVPSSIIFDTDISSDVDDVGAVAVLHSLAEEGKIQILAMMVSSGDPWSVPCLRALNSWYGKGEIPVGQVKSRAVVHMSKYTEKIAREFGFGSTVKKDYPDAVALYRAILAEQSDNSVTIVTVGYLTNLHNLINSPPDVYSPLHGRELVSLKVSKLVTMGGRYPNGREWNFYQDIESTRSVVENWPTSIVFIGYEAGVDVLTGGKFQGISNNGPVARAYALYNDTANRPSWDQIAVLYGVVNEKKRRQYWSVHSGYNSVLNDGSNTWKKEIRTPTHKYVTQNIENQTLINLIDKLMLPPYVQE